uniref:G-protein coupled receptors family 1 profile domain-containing protein n=1 Tax=Ditylenchus dipsaci TaxID=166011 RepID=A0A915DU54_9BILA
MVVVPHTLFPSLTHTSLIYQYPVTFDSLGQVASIHFSLLQAISLVVVPQLGNTWVCITLWIANAVFLLLFYYANCAKQFHPYLLHFQHFCDPSARGIWVALNIWLATLLLLCLAIYVVAMKTKGGRSKEKSSLLIQGFLVSLTNSGHLVLGLAMPWLTTQPGLSVDVIAGGCVLGNCLVLVCLASNPLIYCMFNKKIRRIFSRLCSCCLIVKDPETLLRSNSNVSRY